MARKCREERVVWVDIRQSLVEWEIEWEGKLLIVLLLRVDRMKAAWVGLLIDEFVLVVKLGDVAEVGALTKEVLFSCSAWR